ncbi:hypothetical protein ACJXWG_004458 [Vibrio parahaemolyticus]
MVSKLLDTFNLTYNKSATIYRQQYEHDLDHAYTVLFYEKARDHFEQSKGFYLLRLVGGYRGGEYYEKGYACVKSGYFVTDGNEEKGYPISPNEISVGSLRVGYRSTSFDSNPFESTQLFNRFWVSDIDIIKNEHPEVAQQIQHLLDSHISYLAEIQQQRGYKSTWVYYRFQEKRESLINLINGQLLKDTRYFYCPQIHYNKFSSQMVKFSKKESAQFRQEYLTRWD